MKENTFGRRKYMPFQLEASESSNESVGVGSATGKLSELVLENGSSPSEDKTSTDSSMPAVDANPRFRPSACVFVASLSSNSSDDYLGVAVNKHFSQWGTILSTKVLRDGKNRPYAFVQYGSNEEAQKALSNGHRSVLDEREIRCEPARVNRSVFISPVTRHQKISRSELTETLAGMGEIEDITPFEERNTCWFVRFAYREDATNAYAYLRMNGLYFVQWVKNLPNTEGRTQNGLDLKAVYVAQLSPAVTTDNLQEAFGKFGNIVSCNIIKRSGPNGQLSFAFVHFDSEEAAATCIDQMDHTVFMGHTIQVQSREERQQIRPTPAPAPFTHDDDMWNTPYGSRNILPHVPTADFPHFMSSHVRNRGTHTWQKRFGEAPAKPFKSRAFRNVSNNMNLQDYRSAEVFETTRKPLLTMRSTAAYNQPAVTKTQTYANSLPSAKGKEEDSESPESEPMYPVYYYQMPWAMYPGYYVGYQS